MSPKHPPLTPEDAPFDDIDNPEWTQADFEAAVGPDDLSPIELAAFPKTAARIGRPRSAEPKKMVTMRLSQPVLRAFRSDQPGWQSRIDAALMGMVGGEPSKGVES